MVDAAAAVNELKLLVVRAPLFDPEASGRLKKTPAVVVEIVKSVPLVVGENVKEVVASRLIEVVEKADPPPVMPSEDVASHKAGVPLPLEIKTKPVVGVLFPI